MSKRTAQIRVGGLASLAAAGLVAALMFASGHANAAAPPVNTPIGNSASASYNDGSGTRTVTSNTVTTVVQQIAGLTLISTQTKTVSPGGTVYFPHTLTNTGNGSDNFNLSASGAVTGDAIISNRAVYLDANGDGIPDSATTVANTGNLTSGGVFRFVVAVTTLGSSLDADDAAFAVTATSQVAGVGGVPSISAAANTDTVYVTGASNLVVTKAVSAADNSTAGPYKYTLTYTNTGNADASTLVITDNVPAGLSIVANSGEWSVNNSTGLTDADDAAVGTDPTITYKVVGQAITVAVSKVTPGETRTVSFSFNVAAGTAPATLTNSASFTYGDSATAAPGKSGATNDALFTVRQVAAVDLSDDNAGTGAASTTDATYTGESTLANDVVNVASASQGATIPFDVILTNTGNASDTFNVGFANVSFPAGTTFVLYKSDQNTPLANTNVGDSTPDTGPLAKSTSYHVFVKAILPPSASGGGAYTATVTGSSVFDATKTDSTTLRLGTITANTVDLTNNIVSGAAGCVDVAGLCGFGAGPEAAAQTTNALNPGTSTTFVLKIKNTSLVNDSYDLAASTDGAFAALTLPTNWTVSFKADASAGGDCSSTGATLTNTGTLNAGASIGVCAAVSVPANAAGGTTDLYFRAMSPATGALDRKLDAVKVNAIRALDISPLSGTGQIFKGGTKYYTHTITNNGNVTEGAAAALITFASPTDSKTGWSSILYWDADCSGTINGAEAVAPLTDLNTVGGLAAGTSACLIVKVQSFSGASIGDSNVTTIATATTGVILTVAAPTVKSATDTTTIIGGSVSLNKTQALDASCDGTCGGTCSYQVGDITTNAIPGACIRYRIVATNVGTQDVNALIVTDAAPSNTVYSSGAPCTAAGTPAAEGASPAAVSVSDAGTANGITIPSGGNCTNGTFIFDIGTLKPSQAATMIFGVMIKNSLVP